ncbi:uncharacterized protein [Maniola hyperantus]|uniref:uncharacterized protein n=1 Tax=Aphantopus hyperantus TaxID=2795564 RepID=UPI003747C366
MVKPLLTTSANGTGKTKSALSGPSTSQTIKSKESEPVKKGSSKVGQTPEDVTREKSVTVRTGDLDSLANEANNLYQEATLQLEQSANLKTTIRDTVMNNLGKLYNIVLTLDDSRKKLQTEKAKKGTDKNKTISEELNEDIKEILTCIKEQKETVEQTKKDVNTIRDRMERLNEEQRSQNRTDNITYAEIAAKTKTMNTKAMHSIVVSSSDSKDKGEEVVNKIRTAVNAKETGIRVDSFRKAKDQKVVIGCCSKEELGKIAEKIKASKSELVVEERSNKDPLVILRDVLKINSDEDVVKALKTQNRHLFNDIQDVDYRTSVKYRRKTRNPHTNHIVLQVSPKIWQKLTTEGKVHVDLQRIIVKDQTPLVQCSRCLEYGHGRRLCKEATELCSHCAGPHMRANCPAWLSGDSPTCRNCMLAKNEKSDHNCFDECCPVRRKWDCIARSSVAYC